ncbi:hypothetical protein PR048_014155 [Dryococelus australis]|uniref:Uncharacterized protein n=1 Tax=Dryococelus australis TaxID=614101 RepID=A0ABQ9HE65_9NEOP|nr:hypothetical protein PR048_014155 [Dryococelus australis]
MFECRQVWHFVDLESSYLGARPACLVREESALVEVKFVPSAKPPGVMETARQNRTYNTLKRKKTHRYFYKVQGVRNITGRQFCYFVVMTDKQESLHTEKLSADETFWRQNRGPYFPNTAYDSRICIYNCSTQISHSLKEQKTGWHTGSCTRACTRTKYGSKYRVISALVKKPHHAGRAFPVEVILPSADGSRNLPSPSPVFAALRDTARPGEQDLLAGILDRWSYSGRYSGFVTFACQHLRESLRSVYGIRPSLTLAAQHHKSNSRSFGWATRWRINNVSPRRKQKSLHRQVRHTDAKREYVSRTPAANANEIASLVGNMAETSSANASVETNLTGGSPNYRRSFAARDRRRNCLNAELYQSFRKFKSNSSSTKLRHYKDPEAQVKTRIKEATSRTLEEATSRTSGRP